IEQHRVYSVVPHRVRFALFVASNQIGVHLFDLLGNEAKLRDPRGVKVMLITEGHRFECENRFARLVHRFDLILETLRRDDRAQLTVSIEYYPAPPCNVEAMYAGYRVPPLI